MLLGAGMLIAGIGSTALWIAMITLGIALAFCLARAVDEDKSVQAYLKGRRQLVIFDDVDVFMPVERELGGAHAAIPYVIRRANHKSLLDIPNEPSRPRSPPGRRRRCTACTGADAYS